MTVVSRMSARVFMGKDLCDDQNWTKAALSYTAYQFEYRNMLSEWPMFLRTLVYKLKPNSRILRERLQHCQDVLRPHSSRRHAVMRQVLQRDDKNPYNDAIGWFAEEMGDRYDPAASQISLSLAAIHTTTDLLFQTMIDISKHPERYDPYRYIKMREESPSRENRTHLVNVSDEHFGFGHGYHACPDRFFAAKEIKIIALAHMLLKYDWKLAEGTAELKPLAKGQNLVCNPAIKLLVRRRRE